jgi:hypothetical protein
MLWNQGKRTDKEVIANRVDIIIKKQKEKTADRNATQRKQKRN